MNANPEQHQGCDPTGTSLRDKRGLSLLVIKADIEHRWPLLRRRERRIAVWAFINVIWTLLLLSHLLFR